MQTLTLENDFLRTFAKYVVVAPEETEIKKQMRTVGKQLTELQTKRAEMFPFESKTAIDAAIKPISQKYRKLSIADAGYTEMLSLDAFTLRRADGLPSFMIVNIEEREPIFGIRVTSDGRKSFTHYSIPSVVQDKMQDVVNLLASKIRWYQSGITMHAELSGHMPDDVRAQVKAAKEAKYRSGWPIFDKIFVIAEAPEWKFNAMPIAKTDPLVVGYEDHCKEFFLITTYDPTDLEKYLLEQYTHTFG